MDKRPNFSQLTLAALLGAISAIAIIGGTIAILFPGDAAIQERGSGRSEFIIGDSQETQPPPKRRTEIAQQHHQTQTTEKGPTTPPNPGENTRRE
jgi:hypothetical protein